MLEFLQNILNYLYKFFTDAQTFQNALVIPLSIILVVAIILVFMYLLTVGSGYN